MGGQQSSGRIESLIATVAECDLMIDATADARAFNYLCFAVAVGKKPFVWAQVFAGGVGGMVARHRPGLDPDPASMRAVIEQWCNDRGKPIERAGIDYETRGSGPPLIAGDADVTVIAGHATRLAIDVLIPRSPSLFLNPAYMIGLAPGWIFDQAFETYPIDVSTSALRSPYHRWTWINRLSMRSALTFSQCSRSYPMKVLLPRPVTKRLACELRRAGKLEIGGLLMGEHVRCDVPGRGHIGAALGRLPQPFRS